LSEPASRRKATFARQAEEHRDAPEDKAAGCIAVVELKPEHEIFPFEGGEALEAGSASLVKAGRKPREWRRHADLPIGPRLRLAAARESV
jgi:hypothetical protein